MKKNVVKTTFESLNNIATDFAQYFTLQDNDINQYARVCFTDDYTRDNYKIFKDFAIYYDRYDSYLISINSKTLLDTAIITDKQATKKNELKFSVNVDELRNVLYEILAQRLLQTEKAIDLQFSIKTTVSKKRQKKEA